MSYKAYIDNIRAKTGKGPDFYLVEAKKKGLTTHKELLNWLKGECGLGHGHANAIILYIQNPEGAKQKIADDIKNEKEEIKEIAGGNMSEKVISGGTVHKLPDDLRAALVLDSKALAKWESLTPLARNEWICWTIFVKQEKTRKEHVKRVVSELKDGMRRPCCWLGCIHRKDKAISPSVQGILNSRKH